MAHSSQLLMVHTNTYYAREMYVDKTRCISISSARKLPRRSVEWQARSSCGIGWRAAARPMLLRRRVHVGCVIAICFHASLTTHGATSFTFATGWIRTWAHAGMNGIKCCRLLLYARRSLSTCLATISEYNDLFGICQVNSLLYAKMHACFNSDVVC